MSKRMTKTDQIILKFFQAFPGGFYLRDLNKTMKQSGAARIESGQVFTDYPEELGIWEGKDEGLVCFGCLHPEKIKNYL